MADVRVAAVTGSWRPGTRRRDAIAIADATLDLR
jgi:hypothetical protein